MRSRVRPVDAARVAAGPNAVRGSGPNRFHALGRAMTQAGCPDPRSDRICITSSCPHQFVEAFGPCRLCRYWEQSRLLEALRANHDGPRHACDLAGQRDSSDLDQPAFHDTREPEPLISPSCRCGRRNRRPIVASQYSALCIAQQNELIWILPAQRVVYAARNIQPVVVGPLFFHLKLRRPNFTTA